LETRNTHLAAVILHVLQMIPIHSLTLKNKHVARPSSNREGSGGTQSGYKLTLNLKIINLGICIAPTQLFRAILGAESRVCYPGNTADRQTQ
jgi:hypothetical protein